MHNVVVAGYVHRVVGWSKDRDGYWFMHVDSPTSDVGTGTVPYRHYPREWGQPPLLVERGGQPECDGSDECPFLEGAPCYIVEGP